jgi:hypothetical protein
MSGEALSGSIQPPQRTDAAALLSAFRRVTDWTDEDVLHYASCDLCDPLGGDEGYWCRDSPREQRWRAEHEATKPRGEPVRPQPPLAAALRRMGEQITADAKARVLLHHGAVRTSVTPETIAHIRQHVGDTRFASGGVITGTAGGPYCGVCGTPAESEPVTIAENGVVVMKHACPNGCDPRRA